MRAEATRPHRATQLALELNMERHIERAVDRNQYFGLKSGLHTNVQNGPCDRTTLPAILNRRSQSAARQPAHLVARASRR